MKYVLLALACALPLSANANLLKNMMSDETLDTKQYEIEVSGENARGYVVNVPEMKSVCFIVWGSEPEAMQLECKTYKEMGNEY